MEQKPKLYLAETIILLMIAVIIDATGIFLLFFALDDFFITDIFGLTMNGYFRIRKVNGAGYDLVASLLEVIPYLGALPFKTVGVATVAWIDSHPTSAIAKTAQVASIKKPVSKPTAVPKIDSVIKKAA
ncbi:MAG: hypothetical protein Q8O87_03180 [bacterium]|nr:hypothetical protein [bacterium]